MTDLSVLPLEKFEIKYDFFDNKVWFPLKYSIKYDLNLNTWAK